MKETTKNEGRTGAADGGYRYGQPMTESLWLTYFLYLSSHTHTHRRTHTRGTDTRAQRGREMIMPQCSTQ